MEREAFTISVIVPTYGRRSDVERCINSLQEQSRREFDIVLVDNAADPSLAEWVARLNVDASVPVTYLAETRSGAHNARHAGALAAGGDLLLFTDDDASFDPSWVDAYARCFKHFPSMAAAAGPVRPQWEEQPPKWLLALIAADSYFYPLSLMDLGGKFRLSTEGFFFSVNMAIWRDVLFDVGGFHPDSVAGELVGDGETGLYREMQRRGMQIGYVPAAVVFHHIPRSRQSFDYLFRRIVEEGRVDAYAHFGESGVSFRRIISYLAVAVMRSGFFMAATFFIRRGTGYFRLRVAMREARAKGRVAAASRLLRDQEFRRNVVQKEWLAHEDGGHHRF